MSLSGGKMQRDRVQERNCELLSFLQEVRSKERKADSSAC